MRDAWVIAARAARSRTMAMGIDRTLLYMIATWRWESGRASRACALSAGDKAQSGRERITSKTCSSQCANRPSRQSREQRSSPLSSCCVLPGAKQARSQLAARARAATWHSVRARSCSTKQQACRQSCRRTSRRSESSCWTLAGAPGRRSPAATCCRGSAAAASTTGCSTWCVLRAARVALSPPPRGACCDADSPAPAPSQLCCAGFAVLLVLGIWVSSPTFHISGPIHR
jgi:hypothetical protein